MAFSLFRQDPALRQDGAGRAWLDALAAASAAVGGALGARPEALREVLDALATDAALPPREPGRGRRKPVPLHLALESVRTLLFDAPGRDRESRLLWREALATAWIAAAIARLAGGSPGTAGLAGLLHRAGEGLALRAVVEVEAAQHTLLDAASVQAACAALEPELTATLGRSWRLPPGVLAALQGWRRVGETPAVGAEARAVHFGHAFASQVLFAEFPAPGLAAAVEAELRLDRRETARLRAGLEPLKAAIDSLVADAPTRR